MKTFEFTNKERDSICQMFNGNHRAHDVMSSIEAIVSERINTEPETIKPYHEHGNSVASDRTESGQSADEIIRHDCYHEDPLSPVLVITKDHALQAMHTYAAQVCADKDREIIEWSRLNKSTQEVASKVEVALITANKTIADQEEQIDSLNESLTVMLRKNADLEKEIVDCKKSMLSAGMISGKDAEKFTKRHNISIENIDLRKIENGYDINNPKTK